MQPPQHSPLEAYEGYYGVFSKKKMAALLDVRDAASWAIRQFFRREGFTEVTTATIVNIAGSCENPYASFPLEFYGGEAYLSQSAQLQLEPIVIRLKRKVFTSAMSFRAENYDDPESPGRRLSEFSLAEIEMPFENMAADSALTQLSDLVERFMKFIIADTLANQRSALELLGADLDLLSTWIERPFQRITWDEASPLLEGASARVISASRRSGRFCDSSTTGQLCFHVTRRLSNSSISSAPKTERGVTVSIY